jgi:hypothetical protein
MSEQSKSKLILLLAMPKDYTNEALASSYPSDINYYYKHFLKKFKKIFGIYKSYKPWESVSQEVLEQEENLLRRERRTDGLRNTTTNRTFLPDGRNHSDLPLMLRVLSSRSSESKPSSQTLPSESVSESN